MVPVSGIRGSGIAATGRWSREEAASSHQPATETGRALIALQPIARTETPLRGHPEAGFLAHLIATDDKLPQTRARRRATPQDAIAAYAAANAAAPARNGRILSRTT